MNRREFLKTSAAASLAPLFAGCDPTPRWQRDAYIRPKSSKVAILAAEHYGKSLGDIIQRGIRLCHLEVRGKRVLLDRKSVV